jgi:hypothetical protein
LLCILYSHPCFMENYPNPHEFRASDSTLKYWLSTRKNVYMLIPGINHPGIFRTDEYRRDNRAFWWALVFEIVGGGLVVYGAQQFGLTALLIALLVIGGMVWLDVLIAKALVRNQGRFRWVEAKKLLEENKPDRNEAKILQYDNYLKHSRAKTNDALLIFSLYLIAAVKWAAFTLLIPIHVLYYVVLGAIFLRIAYIHQKYTGFKFKEDAFQKELKIDHLKWVNGDTAFSNAVQAPPDLTLAYESDFAIDVSSSQQTIRLRSEQKANGLYRYVCAYKTVLFDTEIKSLIDNIPTDTKYLPLKNELALGLLNRQTENVPVMVLEPQLVKGPI